MVNCTTSPQTDLKSAIIAQVDAYLHECSVDEVNGNTFSGEAWAYKRVLNFLNGMQPTVAAA